MCSSQVDVIQDVASAVVSSRWLELQAGQSLQACLYCRSCLAAIPVRHLDAGDAGQHVRYSHKFAPALAARAQSNGHVRFALEIQLHVILVLESPL